jgi:hypothetical protein
MVLGFGKRKKEMEAQMVQMRIAEQEQRLQREEDERQRKETEWQMKNVIEQQHLQREEDERRRKDIERQMRQKIERQQRMILLKQEQEQLALEEQKQNELAKRLSQITHEAEEKARHERRIARLKLTTPEALYNLRGLVRMKYQLDIEIWGLRWTRGPDRHIVERKMDMADAVLLEIITMVDSWEESDTTWTQQEWKLAQMVKERIEKGGKRTWANNPPWREV